MVKFRYYLEKFKNPAGQRPPFPLVDAHKVKVPNMIVHLSKQINFWKISSLMLFSKSNRN